MNAPVPPADERFSPSDFPPELDESDPGRSHDLKRFALIGVPVALVALALWLF